MNFKHVGLICAMALVLSCATYKERAEPPIIPVQTYAVGEAVRGPLPPEFTRKRKVDLVEGHNKIERKEVLVSLLGLDKSLHMGRTVSINMVGATIEDVTLGLAEVSRVNFLIHPSAKHKRIADVSLHNVRWEEALAAITRASSLMVVVNGETPFVGSESVIPPNAVLVISTIESWLAEHDDMMKTANARLSIADKQRSIAQQKRLTLLIADRGKMETKSRKLRYADPGEVKKYLNSLYRSRRVEPGEVLPDSGRGKAKLKSGSSKERLSGRISFSIFKTMSLITINAPQRKMDEIMARIDEIDVAPKQIRIEARIVEIQRNFIKDLGVQWGGYSTSRTNSTFPNTIGVYGGGQAATGENSGISLAPDSALDPATGQALTSPQGAAVGVTIGSISGTTLLNAKLFALERTGVSRTLSNPKVTAINGAKAVIKSGKEIPYQSVSGNWGTTVHFKEAVISLTVTPVVVEENHVRLRIEAKKDEIDTALSVQGTPAIKKKELTTTVVVASGGSAALGGIFVGEESEFAGRVPWFHKIPGLGWLFKNDREVDNELELLIFITPTIIENG